MKKFLIVAAMAALLALPISADEPTLVTTAPPAVAVPAPGTTIVAAPVQYSQVVPTTTAPARRGLFGRLRSRNTSKTVMSAPLTSSVITAPTAGAVITPTPVPVPMPSVAPSPKAGASSTVPAIVGNPVVVVGSTGTTSNPVVVAGGTIVDGTIVVPASGVMTSNGMVMMAGGTMADTTMMMDSTMTTTPTTKTHRMGLLARLRARR